MTPLRDISITIGSLRTHLDPQIHSSVTDERLRFSLLIPLHVGVADLLIPLTFQLQDQ
jgi:hypothetical protein